MSKKITCIICIILMMIGIMPINTVLAEDETETAMLSRELVNLYPAQSFRLTVTDTRHIYEFSSLDESIATVDETGIVYAKSVGITEVVCKFATGTESHCTINVKQGKSPEKVTVSQQSVTLLKGEKTTLKAVSSPAEAGDYLSYVSSDESVARVDQNGQIEALRAGVTVITVESESSAVAATCIVRVLSETGHNDFGSDISGVLYNIAGERLINTPVELKSNTYSSTAATDSQGRFRFRNVNTGNYVLSVYSGISDADFISANVNITSSDIRLTCIQADSGLNILYGSDLSSGIIARDITLNQSTIKMNSGEVCDIGYTVTPSEAADINIIFKSSDKSVADIDDSGRITAIKEGEATISVSSPDGIITKQCVVYVSQGGIGNFAWALIFMQLLVIVIVISVFLLMREDKRKSGEVK